MVQNKYLRASLRIGAPLVFWVGLLWAIAALLNEPFLLPTPPAILNALLALLGTKTFYVSVALSLLRVLGGLGIGILCGTSLGLLAHFIPALTVLIRPLLTVIRSTPVASVVILVWSFTGSKILPFVIAAMMVTPIIADELSTGLSHRDRPIEEVSDLFGFSPWRSFLVWRLPAALPYFFGAIVTSVGFAWKAGIAAEILAATFRSVGRELYYAKLYLEIDKLWAYTLTVVIFSVILEVFVKKTLLYVERRAVWKH